MKVAVCSAQPYDRQFLLAANSDAGHELVFFDSHLCEETRQMVAGFPAVCVFVNDTLNAMVLEALAAQGTRLVALRCAGFNNVDIQAASEAGASRGACSGLLTAFCCGAHRPPDAGA